MSKEIAQTLSEAKALIQRGWCRGQMGETADGKSAYLSGCIQRNNEISLFSPEVCKFCLSGALCVVTGVDSYEAMNEHPVFQQVSNLISRRKTSVFETIYSFNDRQSSSTTVISLLDQAIQLASQDSIPAP